jgi:PPOX class probable F420-dependent enzyme
MFEKIEKQQYINLETFRKNGVGMRTPVWFVHKGDTIFVRTVDNSGKVKRVRNNGSVNIAPCKADGALLGEWQAAQAREITGEEVNRVVDMLLDKKYGLMKKLFALASRMQGRAYTVLEIKPG